LNYTSSTELLGLPLVQVRSGPQPGEKGLRGVARAWIAIGDVAFGVVFSVGGVAVGGVAIGGLSAGVVALGGMALGGVALGGCSAAVLLALGGAAFGWIAAIGGLAVSKFYALGGSAIAMHANDKLAMSFFDPPGVFARLPEAAQGEPLIHVCWAFVLLPFFLGRREMDDELTPPYKGIQPPEY
jgi:hypothetical protein